MNLFRKNKKKSKKNQLTTGKPEALKGVDFEIHNYFTPSGVKKLKHLKFKDFPSAQFINQVGVFYQFILIKDNLTITAFCLKK